MDRSAHRDRVEGARNPHTSPSDTVILAAMSGLFDPTPLAWQDPLGGPLAPAAANLEAPSTTPAAGASPAQAATTQTAPTAVFPLFHRPLDDFHTGARSFRAPRALRLHAAVDLLAPHLAKVRAIADGTVIRRSVGFYLGTNELEVDHPGIGVVRYGEIDAYKIVGLKERRRGSQGDVIAYVGRLQHRDVDAPLRALQRQGQGLPQHGHPAVLRRNDLLDPTKLVEQLQKATFGQ